MPIDYGTNNVNTSGVITATSGNFLVLQVNSTGVSISGHSHGNISSSGTIGSTSGLIVATSGNGTLVALSTGTYPSLTELSFVKGASSSIQTQLDNFAGKIGEIIDVSDDSVAMSFDSSAGGWSVEDDAGFRSAINFNSSVSGLFSKTYSVFSATHNQPPASAFATLDTRNSVAVLDFDDTTKETAVFVGVMPQSVALASGLFIRTHWMATTATSGDCRWEVSLERSNTDLDSDSFDTVSTGSSTTNGTAGIPTTTSITLTTIDSVTAGDLYRLRVSRDAANGADTMVGDAELIAVEVRSAG